MTYQVLVAAYKAAGNEAEVKKWTSECIEKGFSLRTAAPQKGGPVNERKDPRVSEFASLIQKKSFNEANAHWKELAADGRPSTYAYNLQLKSLRMQDKLQVCSRGQFFIIKFLLNHKLSVLSRQHFLVSSYCETL